MLLIEVWWQCDQHSSAGLCCEQSCSAGALGWMWVLWTCWALGQALLLLPLPALLSKGFAACSKICALMYFVFLSPCWCLFCAAEALRAMLLHPFKALPSSHFGPADCLEVLVYEQVLMPFLQESTREFFSHMELMLFFSVPFQPLW